MTPEKLNTWLYKPCPGGVALQLAHGQAGPTPDLVVASWSRDEVFGARDAGISQADVVIDEAQDHADSMGESCKFLIAWVSEAGRPLRTIVHRVSPVEPTNNIYAANADAISTNAMIAQFLGHIHQQQKLVNGNMLTVCTAYERAMGMQQAMLTQMSDLVKSHRRELDRLADVTTVNPEAGELARLKSRAFEKLIELGPDVVKLAIASFAPGGAGVAGDDEPAAAAAAPHVNGMDLGGAAA